MPEHGASRFSIADLRALASGEHRREVHKIVVAWARSLPWEQAATLLAQAKKRSGRSWLASCIEACFTATIAALGLLGLLALLMVLSSAAGAAVTGWAGDLSGLAVCAACCLTPIILVGSLVWAGNRVHESNIARGLLSDACASCGYVLDGLGGVGSGVTCPECGESDPRTTMASWALSRLREQACQQQARRALAHAGRRTRMACIRAWKPVSEQEQRDLRDVCVPLDIAGGVGFALLSSIVLSVWDVPRWAWFLTILASVVLGWLGVRTIARRRFVWKSIRVRISENRCPCCGVRTSGAGSRCGSCGGVVIRISETPERVLAEKFEMPETLFCTGETSRVEMSNPSPGELGASTGG